MLLYRDLGSRPLKLRIHELHRSHFPDKTWWDVLGKTSAGLYLPGSIPEFPGWKDGSSAATPRQRNRPSCLAENGRLLGCDGKHTK